MARLPKKPGNIVHEFFPVGTDGHSPMNNIDGAFEAMQYVKGKHPKYNKDKDEDEDTLFNKNDDTMLYEIGPGKFEPGETPEEKAARILKLKADTNKATQEGLLKKINVPLKKTTVRTVASGRLKSTKKKKDEKKKMHISADLSNLTKDQKKAVVKAGRGDKGGYNTKGSADLAASGLKASNELKNLRR